MNRQIKIKILLILFVLVFAELRAQKHPQFQYISLDAGLNMSGIRSAGHYDNHARNPGIRISFSGNYSLSNSRSVGASFSFDQKGGTDPVHKIYTNLNYFTVPVYFKFSTGKEPKFFFTAGSYFSSLISASRKGELFMDGNMSTVNKKVTAEFNRFDVGLTAGGGMIIRLYDDLDFKISAGISPGLMKIMHIPDQRPRNFLINLSAGYIYYVGYR